MEGLGKQDPRSNFHEENNNDNIDDPEERDGRNENKNDDEENVNEKEIFILNFLDVF